jgi:DNA-binding Lrp family transcriptional regulator
VKVENVHHWLNLTATFTALYPNKIIVNGGRMVSAMVLVRIDNADQSKVLESIKQLKGVEEAHALWGIYDLMVKITANSIERLKEIIRTNLRQMVGVANTLTLMVIQ